MFSPLDKSMKGHPMFNGNLLTIKVIEGDFHDEMITKLPQLPGYLSDLRNIRETEIHGHFIVEMDGALKLNREWFSTEDNYRYIVVYNQCVAWCIEPPKLPRSPPKGFENFVHILLLQFISITYRIFWTPLSLGGGGWIPANNYHRNGRKLINHTNSKISSAFNSMQTKKKRWF